MAREYIFIGVGILSISLAGIIAHFVGATTIHDFAFIIACIISGLLFIILGISREIIACIISEGRTKGE